MGKQRIDRQRVVLRTRAAVQLWDGRRASKQGSFIPGLASTQHVLQRLCEGSGHRSRDLALFREAVALGVRQQRQQLGQWSVQTEVGSAVAVGAGRVHFVKSEKSVYFSDPLVRQLANLVVLFDRRCACYLLALDGVTPPWPLGWQQSIKEYQQSTRQLFSSVHQFPTMGAKKS